MTSSAAAEWWGHQGVPMLEWQAARRGATLLRTTLWLAVASCSSETRRVINVLTV